MAVTQYIGSRYVPLFADPIDWDITRAYEPFTIVYYQGNSYTSRQSVPTGIDVTNTSYWALTGNYNAQVEQYRREVQTFDGRITANAQAIADEVTARMQEDTAIRALITNLTNDLESEESARETADAQIRTDFTMADTAMNGRLETVENTVSILDDPYIAIVGDSFSDDSNEWPSILAENSGYKILNGAVAASTFGSNAQGKQFIQQLTELSQNANWNKVTHLIVYGGINDWSNLNATATQTNTYVNAFINKFKQLTHRPKITFVMGNCGAPDRDFSRTYLGYPTYVNDLIANIKEKGFDAVPAYAWLLGYANGDVFNSDNLHPTSLGENIIASKMLSIIAGSYTPFVKRLTRETTSDPTHFNGKCVIDIYDTYCTGTFKAKAKQAVTKDEASFYGLFVFNKRLWFGRSESENEKLKLLTFYLDPMNWNSGNSNLLAFANMAVTFFGYRTLTANYSIAQDTSIFNPGVTLPFE